MKPFTLADAVELMGDELLIPLPDGSGSFPLRVASVQDRGSTAHFEQFSIVLEGDMRCVLSQGTFALRGLKLGEAHWFLVPIGRSDDRMTYEAVFSIVKPMEGAAE
ncbi:DUF6916 family protein [Paenibacillus flagellatus]|uniref:DUF6916 domain-containing protein n=1 Tax=Paenibacillus flagellatus TaxID=2211139 RepID=A0A2V5KEH2_9BACL|nr:hypothetical protein [Paenibacillus flagellatus]PYI56513.1 hypothetical protein DLM86_05955 [Paenibacillus flagellatus]